MGDITTYPTQMKYQTHHDIVPPQTMWNITETVKLLIEKRRGIYQQITELTAEGCIQGNIAEEWRGENGPYYRLHFYTDPVTGIKPSPKYLGSSLERKKETEKQMENYAKRARLWDQANAIDTALDNIRLKAQEMQRYLDLASKADYYQQGQLL